MDYPTLLLQLENQLQFLYKNGVDYLNIEDMTKVQLSNFFYGLNQIVKTENKNTVKKLKSQTGIVTKTSLIETDQYKKIQSEIPAKTDKTLFSQEKIPSEKKHTSKENIEQKNNKNKFKNRIMHDLYKKYESCQKCELGKTRLNLVFGNGSSDSQIMFIGEGPGADEDELGEPFIGRAGKLLTKMINSIGIERQDVYITNIVKCRPPQNRNPTSIEISCCLPILKKQIELVNPKLIITLGNVPAQTLIPNLPGITKIHGRILQYENWRILPTFHPSYLLRNRSSMPLAWEDFKIIPKLAFN